MLKSIVSSLAACVLATVPSVAFAATSTSPQPSSFTSEQKLSTAEINSLESQAIVENGQKQNTLSSDGLVSPNQLPASGYITSPNWSYTGLGPYSFIDTRNSYSVSATEQVWLNAVQYNGGSDMEVTYQLINISGGSNSTPITVPHNYYSSDCYVYFNNVAPGTYKLRIYNPTSDNIIDGNGYTHYY